jgi:electron transfer flavoprotein beta subunit
VRIVVLIKQVPDPLLPVSELTVSPDGEKILGPENVPPVVNGYDEQAIEAALRIKDSWDGECEIIALSAGADFVIEVFQRSLVETDNLVLVKDDSLDTSDPHQLSRVLGAAIQHLGDVELVLGGRQASDWDHGQVPLALAEHLEWPCLTLARAVRVDGARVEVERVLSNGYQLMECGLPAVVTVTSELGELRYPTMQMRLRARRRRPTYLSLEDLQVGADIDPEWRTLGISMLEETRDCRFIGPDDGAEAGRQLAALLLEEGAIASIQPREGT